jgi:hypothetical protein
MQPGRDRGVPLGTPLPRRLKPFDRQMYRIKRPHRRPLRPERSARSLNLASKCRQLAPQLLACELPVRQQPRHQLVFGDPLPRRLLGQGERPRRPLVLDAKPRELRGEPVVRLLRLLEPRAVGRRVPGHAPRALDRRRQFAGQTVPLGCHLGHGSPRPHCRVSKFGGLTVAVVDHLGQRRP